MSGTSLLAASFALAAAAAAAPVATADEPAVLDSVGMAQIPVEIRRGPAVLVATGNRLRRIYYYPPWVRGSQRSSPYSYERSDLKSP